MQDDLGSCYVCVDKECRWKWRFSTEASTNGWNCLRGVAPLSNLLGLVHELQYDDGLAGIGQGAQEQRFATKPTLQGFAGARWVLPAVVGESQKARPESYADLSFGAWLSGNSGVRGAKMAERVRTRGGGVDVARCPYVYVYYTSRPVLPVLPYCRTAILPHTQHHTSTIGYFRWSVLERGCLCAHSSIHSIRYIHPPGSTKQVLAAWPALRWGPTIQADLLPRICGGAWAPHGACPQTWHSWCPARLSLTFPSFFCQSRCSVGTKVPVLSQTGTGAC